MLRLLVLLLVLANAGYFAWAHGLLADYGFAPPVQTEPQRLKQQIRPETMQLLTSVGPAPADLLPVSFNPANASGQCLQAGLFSDEQAAALRTRLQASLPPGRWTLGGSVEPGRWIIYLGRYANEAALAKKRNELRLRGLPFEPPLNPALNPGLSLGHFASQAEADAALDRVTQRGVRRARVMQERPEARGQLLRLASVDAPLMAKLDALKPQLDTQALQACR